ncbi:hypothetical protein N9W34_05095 [Rickettsiales bacterium]|nr:hypothetical protein [Rickettsiales bacterium]
MSRNGFTEFVGQGFGYYIGDNSGIVSAAVDALIIYATSEIALKATEWALHGFGANAQTLEEDYSIDEIPYDEESSQYVEVESRHSSKEIEKYCAKEAEDLLSMDEDGVKSYLRSRGVFDLVVKKFIPDRQVYVRDLLEGLAVESYISSDKFGRSKVISSLENAEFVLVNSEIIEKQTKDGRIGLIVSSENSVLLNLQSIVDCVSGKEDAVKDFSFRFITSLNGNVLGSKAVIVDSESCSFYVKECFERLRTLFKNSDIAEKLKLSSDTIRRLEFTNNPGLQGVFISEDSLLYNLSEKICPDYKEHCSESKLTESFLENHRIRCAKKEAENRFPHLDLAISPFALRVRSSKEEKSIAM